MTQENSCVPPQKNSSDPKKSPTLVTVFCTCSYSTIHSPQSLLHHNPSLFTIHQKTQSFETKFRPQIPKPHSTFKMKRQFICSYAIVNLEAIPALTDTGINAQEAETSKGDTKLTCHTAEMSVFYV
jgi:hypothetical protein